MARTDLSAALNEIGMNILTERELAFRWQISPRTLQRWRAEGCGPHFLQIGGSVRYRLADILAYEDRSRTAECAS